MQIKIRIRFAGGGPTRIFTAKNPDDAEAFFRVLAGPGGSWAVSPHITEPGRKAVKVKDGADASVAIAETEQLGYSRPVRDNPQA